MFPVRSLHRCSQTVQPSHLDPLSRLSLTNCPLFEMLLTCFSLSTVSGPKLHLYVSFWFHLLVFLSKTPSRHSHTCTDPTSPCSATETETIQERCVSLQHAAFHLCPITSALLLSLSYTFSCCLSLSIHILMES